MANSSSVSRDLDARGSCQSNVTGAAEDELHRRAMCDADGCARLARHCCEKRWRRTLDMAERQAMEVIDPDQGTCRGSRMEWARGSHRCCRVAVGRVSVGPAVSRFEHPRQLPSRPAATGDPCRDRHDVVHPRSRQTSDIFRRVYNLADAPGLPVFISKA
jgi:hypothetical protein